jgi:hypothetical protein
MPKWHAVRGYGDFRNDPSLSPFEIALIAAWADTGAQKGADAGVPTTSGNAPGRAPEHPVAVREVHVACGRQRIPAGVLLALRPDLDRGESVGIAVRVGSARTDILAWIRDFDPDFTETYWLRTPLHLERAAELVTEGTAACAITLLFSEPRARTGR